MRKIILIIVLLMAWFTFGVAQEETISAEELLDRIDKNMVFKSAHMEADMVITVKKRVITKRFISYSVGNEKSYMEFLSPPRDKGSKILRLDDIVKVYYPSAERVMRLSGHMLRRSMMGSDFSFEDMTERAKKLREEFSAEVTGVETVNDRACYLLVLTSKIKKQTYFTRKVWVDKEHYIMVREELFARSGKLLKTMEAFDYKAYKNRMYPMRMVMEDKLRKNSKTEMVVKSIEFDLDIPEDTFSERRLLKK